MPELVARQRVPPIDYSDVPAGYQPRYVVDKRNGRVVQVLPRLSAVCRSLGECSDLVKWFGDATFCPYLPVLVKAPAGWTAIMGWGYADAAELQDCAIALWLRQKEKLSKLGVLMDFDDLRERAGLMRREDVEAAVADALTRRIAAHKASPVTDPFRQPQYPRWRGRTTHPVADTSFLREART